MKRLHSLLQLGRVKPGLESNADEAPVVNQPVEGQPTVQSTSEVLAEQAQAEQQQQQADVATPADGSVAAADVPGVSQESGEARVAAPVSTETNPTPNNIVDTGDGSNPATPADDLSGESKPARADLGTPVTASQESQETGVVAPVATETKPELNNKVDTGDGSIPATPGDAPGDAGKRADEGTANAAAPAELAPELEQVVVKAPQVTSVAADANNPDSTGKSGEGPATPAQTTQTQNAEITGGAKPADTTNPEKPSVSTEALTPEEIAQVATVAAAAGAAAAGGEPEAAAAADGVAVATDGAAVSGSDGAGVQTPDEAAAAAGSADGAAQAAVDQVAQSPNADTPPGPNAGDAAATPAEAAQVAADLIAANPDTAAEIAQAIDTVADAAVSATQGTEPPTATETDEGNAAAAAADAAADANPDDAADEFADSTADREEAEETLEETDDVIDDVEVSQESLESGIRLLSSLESIVESALQNGGLSDDAAQILQTVTSQVGDEQDLDDTDLGLESLAYSDRRNATNYALSRLQYTREQLEEELSVSQEGLFDLFKSSNSQNRDWIAKALRNISAAKAAIKDPKATVTRNIAGINDREGFVDGADRSGRLLAGILNTYPQDVDAVASEVAKVAERLRDGGENYDHASADMSNIDVPLPKGMQSKGDVHTSGPLFGGTELQMKMSGDRSAAKSTSSRETASVEYTGENALNVLKDAEKLVGFMEKTQTYLDGVEKQLSKADAKGTGKVVAYAFLFNYFALISSDVRRRLYRSAVADDQDNKLGEARAAMLLIKEAMKSARKYVEAAVSAAEAVAK